MEKKEGREREGENCFKPLEPMKPLVIEKKKSASDIFKKKSSNSMQDEKYTLTIIVQMSGKKRSVRNWAWI